MNALTLNRMFKSSPLCYMFYKRLTDKRYHKKVCNQQTDLMIEGFESSGNSFLFATFEYLHPELSVAHHIHKVAHLKRAVKLGINGVVVFREPAQTIASRMAAFDCNLQRAISEYIDLYSYALSQPQSFSLFDFDEVTTRIDLVINAIERLNGFSVSTIDKENVEVTVKALMKKKSADNQLVNRLPDAKRSLKRDAIVGDVKSHQHWPELHKLYDRMIAEKIDLRSVAAIH